ncbi:hypothetical protein [Paenibacillus odorifer]|uniref:hypothetical protein n=2 Tax=Paenibacillus TaxID=44249 RepID=UPI0015C3C13D|nr:hypothetical protein [Paenibacillus odorifer]
MHPYELEGKTIKEVKKRNVGLHDEGIDIVFDDGTILMITGPGTILIDPKTKAP